MKIPENYLNEKNYNNRIYRNRKLQPKLPKKQES